MRAQKCSWVRLMVHLVQNSSPTRQIRCYLERTNSPCPVVHSLTLSPLTMNSPNPVLNLPTQPVFKTSSGCKLHKFTTCYVNKHFLLSSVLNWFPTSFTKCPATLVLQGFCQQELGIRLSTSSWFCKPWTCCPSQPPAFQIKPCKWCNSTWGSNTTPWTEGCPPLYLP